MKLLSVVLWLAAVGCSCINQSSSSGKPAKVGFVVSGVMPQQQRTNMACWITCAAILKSWQDGVAVSPEQLATKLGEPWLLLFDSDAGLPRDKYLDFAHAMGLNFQWPANWLPQGYIDLLKKHGPLWIASGISSHARVLYGVVERNGKTTMLFMDPATGTAREQIFEEFFPEFEKEAVLIVGYRPDLALPIQILHY